jgi:lipoate-protein ligase A
MTSAAETLRCASQGTAGRFEVLRCEGPAWALVEVPSPTSSVRICEVVRPALVLGSTQPIGDVSFDRVAERGTDVCRRPSGGGAVLVEPGGQLWFDVFVPVDDPLFQRDVGRAFNWLGAAVAAAVTAVTGFEADVHAGALVRSRWSGVLCLAGLGPGEVLVGGRKVLGAAQRRDRRGAWFQAMVMLRLDAAAAVALLALSDDDREDARCELAASAGAVEADVGELERALLAELATV